MDFGSMTLAQTAWSLPNGGSGGLSKWVNKGENWGYYMGYRG